MKRFAITSFGDAEKVFQEIEAAPRELTTPRHIRVAIKAFAVNPYDIAFRKGEMSPKRPPNFPYVLGKDAAGIVTEIGEEVTQLTVGDPVIIHPVGGAYGEEIVLPGHKAVLKPENMSWAEAAGLVTPGITAYHLVTHFLKPTPKTVVMVQGASGSVGSLLVQLLKQLDVVILASASSANKSFVEALGVDRFAAYDKEDVGAAFLNQADIVIDATKGGRTSASGMAIMKTGGTYVALNRLPEEHARTKSGTYRQFGPSPEYDDAEALRALSHLFANQQLHINIAQIFTPTLETIVQSHHLLEGHPPNGKLIFEW